MAGAALPGGRCPAWWHGEGVVEEVCVARTFGREVLPVDHRDVVVVVVQDVVGPEVAVHGRGLVVVAGGFVERGQPSSGVLEVRTEPPRGKVMRRGQSRITAAGFDVFRQKPAAAPFSKSPRLIGNKSSEVD